MSGRLLGGRETSTGCVWWSAEGCDGGMVGDGVVVCRGCGVRWCAVVCRGVKRCAVARVGVWMLVLAGGCGWWRVVVRWSVCLMICVALRESLIMVLPLERRSGVVIAGANAESACRRNGRKKSPRYFELEMPESYIVEESEEPCKWTFALLDVTCTPGCLLLWLLL